MDRPDEPKQRVPGPRSHAERRFSATAASPVRTQQRRDSPRLHAMPAGLAMRDHEREEVIDNLQL